MQKEEVSIIYHKYCPFAQRALITAIEKDVDAKFIPTGLGDDTKSELFTSAYARSIARDPTSNGKVPVLIHGPHHITESELVCWYLAESFPTGTQLIPEDKLLRLQMRVWMGQINSQIINLFNRSKAGKITDVPAFVAEVDSFLQRVQTTIAGSFLLGESISLADLMIYPWFQRWVIIQHFYQFPIPVKYGKIRHWLESMGKRKSIIQTKKMTSDEFYIARTNRMAARL